MYSSRTWKLTNLECESLLALSGVILWLQVRVKHDFKLGVHMEWHTICYFVVTTYMELVQLSIVLLSWLKVGLILLYDPGHFTSTLEQ